MYHSLIPSILLSRPKYEVIFSTSVSVKPKQSFMAEERMVETLGLLKSLNMLSWAIFNMPITTACFRWGLSLKVCTMKLRIKVII